ncbi:MAG: hypothetical protein HY006_01105 [Candidatus Sungbacteria bacterium]|nr:hypothetical protein [Candidatus Sungbacteria bacterium]
MLKDLQKRIVENKVKKGFNVQGDYQGVNQEICFLAEELGELAHHHRRGNREMVVDSVVDILLYAVGLLEILGVDGDVEVEKVLQELATRTYVRHEDGTLTKASTHNGPLS